MRVKSQPPFEDYKVYKIFHKSTGRHIAVLFKSEKDRTTIAWAKYLLSVYLGRRLERKEIVDHINGNPLDDRIENLQILTITESNRKEGQGRTVSCLNCNFCGKKFYRRTNRVHDKVRSYCSKLCLYEALIKVK